MDPKLVYYFVGAILLGAVPGILGRSWLGALIGGAIGAALAIALFLWILSKADIG